MNRQAHRFHLKLKENAWNATIVLQFAGVMCNAVLMGFQGTRARRNVGCWDDVEEVLI